MAAHILGIDGGGTTCRAAVADLAGRVLGRGKSGAANILTDPDTAIASITEAASAAFRDAGLDAGGIAAASAFLGVAGTNAGNAVHYVRERLPFRHTDIDSDGLIALQGALGDGDGAVAILGTGSIYMARRAGRVRYIGGWGFIVGDHGGGARLGHALIEEALLAHDGVRPPAPVTDAALAEFGGDAAAIVEFARTARPGDFGRFAPLVFAHAGRGDTRAASLLSDAAAAVNESLDAVMALAGAPRLCLLGGLATLYPPLLSEPHRAALMEPQADALAGAVALALARHRQRTGAPA